MRVQDYELLAAAYGTTPDRLFFPPGDADTPELMRRFAEALASRDRAAVVKALEMIELMPATIAKAD